MHDAEKLKLALGKWLNVYQVIRSVWEIGSRDGQDAIHLKRAFPQADFQLFEPNPDTYSDVALVASQLERVQANKVALGSKAGMATFNKIDRDLTITPWVDGNPGASSFFKANELYTHERYVQTPIEVRMETAESFCDSENLGSPNLIWMDVQGYEGEVIRGFGKRINDVSAIYVELSLKEIYQDQILISDFLRVVDPSFLWVGVLNTGKWQIDCLFVSRRHANLKMKLTSHLLKLSLKSGLRLGITSKVNKQFLRRLLLSPAIVLFRAIEKARWGGATAALIIRCLPAGLRSGHIASALRKIIDRSLPVDSFRKALDVPEIEVLIPCVEKDVLTVTSCIRSLRPSSQNQIAKVTLVVPGKDLSHFDFLAGEVTICSEESVIPEQILDALALFPAERRGWLTQQIIKLLFVRQSESAGVLVVDSDTVLTQPRVWLDAHGKQSLAISNEFHRPYVAHYSKVFRNRGHFRGLSFVTHHQLMQPFIVRQMFPSLDFLVSWIQAIDDFNSGASEYHDYGTFLMSRYPSRGVLSRWANFSAPRLKSALEIEKFAEWVRQTKPETMSVSFHSYNGES